MCTGHYSAVDGGAPKDFDLGRYVVSFHFYFTILGSHMFGCMVSGQLQNNLWNSNSKELGTRKFIKKSSFLQNLTCFTLSSFHAVLTIVWNQSNHNVVPLILATFLTICKEVIWWWESMFVELSNCCWVLATFLTSYKEVFDSVFLSCSWVIIIEFCHHLGYLIKSLRGVEQLSLNLAAFLTIRKRVFDSESSLSQLVQWLVDSMLTLS